MRKPLLLADLPWLLYRSFFALPSSIRGADGAPVNALLGTVNALLGALEALPPRAVVACTGPESAAYRVELYPPYHAHRDAMPAALAAQWPRAPELLQSLGWTVAASDELEADDVMYSYAETEAARGGEALILSGDRDMYGAVGERVRIVELGRGGRVSLAGEAEVRERYGVEPGRVADFIALRGDPSDGIPGAPGVGAKTAAQLLRAHGSLERVLAAARALDPQGWSAAAAQSAQMTARTAAALREHAAQIEMFKQLATLQRVEVKRPRDRATDFAGGARAARELGMRRLAERLERLARERT